MNYLKSVSVIVTLLFLFIINIYAGDVDIKDVAPVVIRTFPVAGSTMVDPSTTKIHVTFSQKMADKMWSFAMQDQGTFPQLNGNPSYEHGMRTCTLNVILEPNKTYVLWINSGKFMNFKGVNGRSAVPYMLSFKTAGKEFDSKKSDSIEASKSWLKLLEGKKFAESWSEAAPYFQHQVTKDAWKKQIGVIYANLGKVKSRKLISASYTKNLPKAPKGEYFIIRFDTSFEGKDKVLETIVSILTKEGKWAVSGYFIKNRE